jgi:hypothetical protein
MMSNAAMGNNKPPCNIGEAVPPLCAERWFQDIIFKNTFCTVFCIVQG